MTTLLRCDGCKEVSPAYSTDSHGNPEVTYESKPGARYYMIEDGKHWCPKCWETLESTKKALLSHFST